MLLTQISEKAQWLTSCCLALSRPCCMDSVNIINCVKIGMRLTIERRNKLMSRRMEKIFIILGMAVFIFFGVQGASMLIVHNDEAQAKQLYDSYQTELTENVDDDFELPEFEVFRDNLQSGGIMILILSVTTVVTGGLSIYFLKKGLRPKLVGTMLLVSGGLVAFLGFAPAMLGSLLYIVSGGMILFKKPKQLTA